MSKQREWIIAVTFLMLIFGAIFWFSTYFGSKWEAADKSWSDWNKIEALKLIEANHELKPLYNFHMGDEWYSNSEYKELLDAYIQLRSNYEQAK